MRIQHRYFTWDNNTMAIEQIKNMLDKHHIKYTFEVNLESKIVNFKYYLAFYLFEDDQHFSEIKQSLLKFEFIPQITTLYEKSDIEKADWFAINPKPIQYPQPESNFGYLAASFDSLNYCKLCGMNKIQKAPLRLKSEPNTSSNSFYGLHWLFDAIFVNEEAKLMLELEKVKGINFSKPVVHKSNKEVASIHQLHIETTLAKGFDNYNTKTITCKIKNEEKCNNNENLNCCGRLKYHHPLIGGYVFDKAVFNPEFEIVQSHEYFGSGANASKLIFVSKRIKKLIEKAKLRGLAFTPVLHERIIWAQKESF
jgi:hypothetical protein